MQKAPLIGLATLLAAGFALAIEPDHLNQQTPPLPPYLKPAPEENFALPPVAPDAAVIMPSAQNVVLDRVLFVGNSVVSTQDLQAVAAPLIGKVVGAADIETLRQQASLLYVKRGYVNSGVVLAADAFKQRTLTLRVIEGRLKEIRLRGLDGLNEHYVADRLAQGDEPFNLQTLGERFQLLLTDPLFDRMNAQLLPDTERGKAILNVDIDRALPYQLSLSANNYRPVSIGAENATLSGWVRNLTGRGDILEASYQSPLGDGSARRSALGWRMPLNTWGTQLSVNYDQGSSSVIEQPLEPIDIQSQLFNHDIGISQTLFETLRHKLVVGINRVGREDRTTLLGVPFSFTPGEPTGTSEATDWRFWQEYSHRWDKQVLALRSTFTKGENNQTDIGTVPGATPDRRYCVWLGQAQYAQRLFDKDTQLIVRLNVQSSPQRLLAMEGMSVGGISTVRGYRENQMVRDNGAVANVELDFPLIADGANKLHLNLRPFFDYGRAWNKGEEKSAISSVGLVARLRWQRWALDLALAKRRSHPDSVTSSGSNLQDKGIHIQVSYNFFGAGQ
ncbi:MAG TPA: ShlB/FhaC/HecB family hemolysin secretion/activation protein [Rhodoferax sp.]|nr:ShlB/FhaC/HecB family hemolysin secretion/activation protein [Rhodoferax sp.]